jgi:hypothetical protein
METGKKPLKTPAKYPYVVIRWMAAVYSRKPVRFVDPAASPTNDDDHSQAITVRESHPFGPNPNPNGPLTVSAVAALIRTVKTLSRDSGQRMCVVLGPKYCIFIEPNGDAKPSDDPPSGGFLVSNVRVEKEGSN